MIEELVPAEEPPTPPDVGLEAAAEEYDIGPPVAVDEEPVVVGWCLSYGCTLATGFFGPAASDMVVGVLFELFPVFIVTVDEDPLVADAGRLTDGGAKLNPLDADPVAVCA